LSIATLRRWRPLALALISAACLPASLPAETQAPRTEDFKDKGAAAEKRHDWLEACRWYDKALRKDRTQADLRDAYQRCLRHVYLVRRHQDPAYRAAVARLSRSEALDVYDQALVVVGSSYYDRSKTDLNSLFQQGVQELRYDLEEDVFLREYLPDARPAALNRFKAQLDDWRKHGVATRSEAHEEVRGLLQAARQSGIDVTPKFATAVALEFASGACNGLDEYSLFLTPGYYTDVQASLQGKRVGVGVDLAFAMDMRIEISRIYPKSPALDAGLHEHDRIVSVGGLRVDNQLPEFVADMLRGEAGSSVDVEVQSPGEMASRVVSVPRRAVNLPSVMDPRLLMIQTADMETTPVGLIQINHFNESTVQDVQECLALLQTKGARALIIDLRGNPGGTFKAGVQTAELFLNEGVIVYSESPLDDYNKPFEVKSKNPVTLPVVVLVDRDTASAAEVVAGALKDNRPGNTLIVGQTTYGKGSIQGVIPLDKAPLEKSPGGIRLTVARLYAPGKERFPYTGRGVTPDVVIDQEGEATTAAGLQAVLQLLHPPGMMH
jgi:carboxyl-terminal processing protease